MTYAGWTYTLEIQDIVIYSTLSDIGVAIGRAITGCRGPKDCLYTNPENCNAFIQCNDAGLAYDMPCAPENLEWNDNKKECDWPVLPKLVHQPQVLRSDRMRRHYPRVGESVLISTVRKQSWTTDAQILHRGNATMRHQIAVYHSYTVLVKLRGRLPARPMMARALVQCGMTRSRHVLSLRRVFNVRRRSWLRKGMSYPMALKA
jgi:hypothetical protein